MDSPDYDKLPPDYDRLPPILPPRPREVLRPNSHLRLSLEERLLRGEPHRTLLHAGLEKKMSEGSDGSASEVDAPGAILRRFSKHRQAPFLDEPLTKHRSTSWMVSGSTVERRAPQRRKMSVPDGKYSPVPQIQASSSPDSVPHSMASGQINFDLLHHLSALPDKPRLTVSGGDVVAASDLEPATKALKLMICVSRNKECLSTMVSYLCLPKFMNK